MWVDEDVTLEALRATDVMMEEYVALVVNPMDELSATETKDERRRRKPPAQPGRGAVYGLGLIGALVWYCQQADEPSEYVVAVLKALVWPAFLVYETFKALHSLTTGGGPARSPQRDPGSVRRCRP